MARADDSSAVDRIDRAFLRAIPLPHAPGTGGKDERGCVLIIGGSREMPGAILLSAIASLRAGAGKLQMATARSMAPLLAIEVPEAKVMALRETREGAIAASSARKVVRAAEGVDALLIGPGMVREEDVKRLVVAVARGLRPAGRAREGGGRASLVLDAEALSGFATRPSLVHELGGRVVVTPHAGEMAKMCNLDRSVVERNPLVVARRAARLWRVVVVLKGGKTFVCSPDGRAACNEAGNPGLATSGSGDTLAGVVAGMLARGAEPFRAAAWAVHVHARAGDALARKLAPTGYLARELLSEIPRVLAALDRRAFGERSDGRPGSAGPASSRPRHRSSR